jgi:hypothetical protein
VNAKLEDAFANGRMVAEVAKFGCAEPSKVARLRDRIAERFQPLIELRGPKKDTRS